MIEFPWVIGLEYSHCVYNYRGIEFFENTSPSSKGPTAISKRSRGMVQNRPRPALDFNTNEKALGEQYVIETNYQQTKNLSFAIDAFYFKAGRYTKATGSGKDITYLSFKSTFKF